MTQCDNSRDSDCASRWETHEENSLDLDTNGWVRSLPDPASPGYSIAGTILSLPQIPNGRYLLLYDGEGTIRYRLGVSRIEAESVPGRDILNIDVGRGPIHIQIMATDPNQTGNYIRNIRLIREVDESIYQTETFNPDFLARTTPFQVLRFMDWMRTNGAVVTRWDERSHPDDHIYSGVNGVPLEIMVQLSNRLGVAPWFNMPHRVDDTYMRNFAESVRSLLDQRLPIYVEYSNEVWNAAFPQQAWMRQEAQNLWPNSPGGDFTKVVNGYGRRAAQMCDIWKGVFGSEKDRVICVMGSQASNAWTASEALNCPLWLDNPMSSCAAHEINALAIAPYFGGYLGGPNEQSRIQGWVQETDRGLNALFDELRQVALPQAIDWVTSNKAVTNQYGLNLVAYEAGQHLVGIQGVENNTATTDLFIAANRDPRMGDLYRDYLNGWDARGGALVVHYSDMIIPSKWGSWGALEHVQQTHSPKYDALMNYRSIQ